VNYSLKKNVWVFIFLIIVSFSNFTFISIVTSDGSIKRTYLYNSKIVYINQGETDLNLENDSHFFNVFMNTSWQTVYLLTVNKPYVWDWDDDGNPLVNVNISSIPSGENVTVTFSMQIIKHEREIPNINFTSSKNREDIDLEFKEDYLQAEGSWLVNDVMLRSLANDIWVDGGETENILKIVTDLADWVGANIVPVNHDVPYYPNQTLITKEGDCDDQANLLITLSRILGIPAYLQVGAIRKYGTDEGEAWDGHIKSSLINIGYHGWAMIYIPPWGWLPFDMTLGWRENTLEVINSAPIWNLDGLKILDIVKSDWAGDGKTQKEEYLKSQLYIHYEDELIIQEGENLWANLPIMWPYGVFLVIGTSIVVFFLITRRKRRNLNISS
jgi:hypothetical protein